MRSRTWVTLLLGACLCFTLVGSARAQAAREKAKAHFIAGEAKYKSGDYAGAIVEFRAADALVPSPILAFNIAISHDKLGQHEDAVKLYRDYLARQPNATNRGQVEARVKDLEATIAAKVAPPAPPTPVPTDVVDTDPSPQPEAAPPPVEPTPARRYDDALARRVPTRGAVAATGSAYAEPPPASAPPPSSLPEPEPKKSTPVYKQWWFWVVVGVSALILIDVASGPDDDSAQPGAIILRF